MTFWKTYHVAKNLADAFRALAANPGQARVIAGGTDLLLDLQQGRHAPLHTLVDVTQIPELNVLEIRGNRLFIGAAVCLNQIINSPMVFENARALFEAVSSIGSPQVRNVATLGGNIAHALPAADGAIALIALDAEAEVANNDGFRRLPISELFLGPGRSALDAQKDILVGFYLPLNEPGRASAFRRVMRPQGVAVAILNMAIWLEQEDIHISNLRIALGPSGPVPFRARNTEKALRGQRFDEKSLSRSVDTLLSEAQLRTSPYRATKEYRRHLVGVLFYETLTTAWERTK